MLRNSSFVIGETVKASDGAIGSVADLLFDDATWAVRWAVIDTGSWLTGRRVLLPPQHLAASEGEPHVFTVPLTKAQVEASPPEDSDLPVSRQYEHQLYGYYQWDPYWIGGAGLGGGVVPLLPPDPVEAPRKDGDPHLRSVVALKEHIVRATDGDIGHVADLLIDPVRWTIPLVELSTRNWLPGRKVLVAPALVERIDWSERVVCFRRTKAEIAAAPSYEPSMTVDRERLRMLYSHYGLPTDWI